MSHRRHALPDELYFVTSSVVAWSSVFIRHEYFACLTAAFQYCRAEKGLEIYAYVLMPNHFHAIVRSVGRPLFETMRDLKRHTAHEMISIIETHPAESRRDGLLKLFTTYGGNSRPRRQYRFWHDGFHPIGLYSPVVTQQKVDYIHLNPVRAGFVSQPDHWLHSSAHLQNPLGIVW